MEPATYYRVDARNVFYTWPRCDTAKELVLQRLVDHWQHKTIDFVIVCAEKHDDGGLHLHAVSACAKPLNNTRADWADKFAGKHGDYKAARNLKASVEYVQKAGDWIVYPDGFNFEKRWEGTTKGGRKRKTVSSEIEEQFKKGKTFNQLLLSDQWSGFFILHSKKALEYESLYKNATANQVALDSKEQWHSVETTPSMSPSECLLVEWLNVNLSGAVRTLGTPQLYLYGPTGIGKTHLMITLHRFFRIYNVCMEEDWMDLYADEEYDLIVFEEFTGQKQISWMNKFIDGQPVPLRRRGLSAYTKMKNLPVVILSNFSVSGAYKNSSEEKLAPLLRRLLVIDAGLDHSAERRINIFA